MYYTTNSFSKLIDGSCDYVENLIETLSISCALFHDIIDDEEELKNCVLQYLEEFLQKASPRDRKHFTKNFEKALFKVAGYEYSWIFVCGIQFSFFALDILSLLIKMKIINDGALLRIIFSNNALIGYDFRGAAKRMLLQISPDRSFNKSEIVSIQKELQNFRCEKRRNLSEKMHIKTDGIDHLFPIPLEEIEKINVLRRATNYKLHETIFLDLISLLSCYEDLKFLLRNSKLATNVKTLKDIYKDAQYSLSANKLLESETSAFGRAASDYLVVWDQVISDGCEYRYTIAELLKMVMLSSSSRSPDCQIRSELNKFYKQILKISEESNIGLGGAVFRAEHGIYERPTTFFLGRKAVVGKGCILETTGGTIISEYSFVGGGFIPLLIHTHMHKANAIAANERKLIIPVVMYMKKGSRIPMDQSLNFEVARYLDGHSPFEGVVAFSMDN